MPDVTPDLTQAQAPLPLAGLLTGLPASRPDSDSLKTDTSDLKQPIQLGLPQSLSTASGPSVLSKEIAGYAYKGALTPELARRSGIPPEYVPVINWINKGEAHGYNELYGGGNFSDSSDHPANLGWPGEMVYEDEAGNVVPSGQGKLVKTTAAGYGQWTQTTWNKERNIWNAAHPNDQIHDFSDVSQNKLQWQLINERYAAHTGGRNIIDDLRAGRTGDILPALSDEWTSLRKGVDGDRRNYGRQDFNQRGMDAMGALGRERQAVTDASIARLQRDQAAALAAAYEEAPGTTKRMQMLEEAHNHARELSKLYEEKISASPEKKPVDLFAGWGGIVAALAAFAGRRSGQPLTASLNGMSGALEAMNDGNERDFHDRMKIWEKQSQFALKAVELQNQDIREILEDQRTAEAEKQAKLNTIFHVNGMDQQIALLQTGQIDKVHQDLYQMMDLTDRMKFRQAEIDRLHQEMNKGWQILTDPTQKDESGNQIQYRYNPNTGEATTLDKQPYTPGGAQKLSGVGAASQAKPDPATVDFTSRGIANYQLAPLTSFALRSPYGQQVMAKVLQINPDYQAANFAARVSSTRAFTSGRQADSVRAFSVAVDHLITMEQLGQALRNNDVRALNALKNTVKTQFGYEGPLDFNFAKTIVGDEVSKAVIGGVGTGEDRTSIQKNFDDANSPEQLVGVAATAKKLIAGQLSGYRRQYERGTGEKDFDELLSPDARREVGALSPSDQVGPKIDIGSANVSQLTAMLKKGGLSDEQLHQIDDRMTALGY